MSEETEKIDRKQIFRRKEDQLKYEIVGKVIGVVKWLIFVNAVLIYFFYSVTSDNKKLTEYQMRLINDLNRKIEKLIILEINDIKKRDSIPIAKANGSSNNKVSDQTVPYLSSMSDTIISSQDFFNTANTKNRCSGCHGKRKDPLIISSSWNYDDFRNYIRGETRLPSNTIMPNFTSGEVSDTEIETLYFRLKNASN